MKPCLFIAAFLLLSMAAFPAVIVVPNHYTTIQGAIDAASAGDTVIVRPGTYKETISFLGKAITVRSWKGYGKTIIDAGSAAGVVRFDNGEGASSVIDGFTITNGYSTKDKGGIIVDNASPTIINNLITRNASGFHGGGINIEFGAPDILYNIFTENKCGGSGYGSGGAISCTYANPVIVSNIFIGNHAGIGDGGAIYTEKQAAPTIANNFIAFNSAQNGGGLGFYDSRPIALNNTIVENQAAGYGGGIFNGDYTTSLVANTIVRKNTASSDPEIHNTAGGSLTVTHCDVLGGYAGAGNFDAVPLFVPGETHKYHLTWNSPCRNSGDNTIVGIPAHDIEGDSRISGGTIDVGADEFAPHLYHLDGIYMPGSPIKVRLTAPAGAAPVALVMSLDVMSQPSMTPYGELYLVLPPAFQIPLGTVPGFGVLTLNATIPLTWPSGEDYYFQALIGPLGNPNSRLTNLMVLHLE
jgi:hypothetical protein